MSSSHAGWDICVLQQPCHRLPAPHFVCIHHAAPWGQHVDWDSLLCRVAGNVVSPHALGSILYAVSNLGSRLVVVLGHTKCAQCIIIFDCCLQGLDSNACCQYACIVCCTQRMDIAMLTLFDTCRWRRRCHSRRLQAGQQGRGRCAPS